MISLTPSLCFCPWTKRGPPFFFLVLKMAEWTGIQKHLLVPDFGMARRQVQWGHHLSCSTYKSLTLAVNILIFPIVPNAFTLFCGHIATPPLAFCDIKKLGESLLVPLIRVQHISALQSPAVPPPHHWPQPWDLSLPLCPERCSTSPRWLYCSVKIDCPEIPTQRCPLSTSYATLSSCHL